MTLKVLELNDNGISIGDANGLIVSSPGYAVAVGENLEFGHDAAGQSKIHPVNSSNEFWHRLSMEPLARPIAHYRHYADIAWSHLMHLAAQTQLEGDIILAVPGSFTRQQLAILLGLIKQSPFNAVGLVDASVAAAAVRSCKVSDSDSDMYSGADSGVGSIIHADIQLHQVVLSEVHLRDGELVREAVIQVPGVGWSNLADSLAQLVTDAFIQQSRFNPQHNAKWEQTLYDSLPRWLSQETEDNNLLLDIQTDSARYQASLTRSSIVAQLRPFYRKITEHLRELEGHGAADGALLLTERMAALPGLRSTLDAMGPLQQDTVSTDALMKSCLRYQEQLLNSSGAVNFVTRLRPDVQQRTRQSPDQRQATSRPTHAMLDFQAWPLGKRLSLGLQASKPGSESEAGSGAGNKVQRFQLNGNAERTLGEIEQQAGQFSLRCEEPGWLLNGNPAHTGQILRTGDVLRFTELEHPIQLIQVHDGQR
jgi:hypothetical protein